MKCPICDIDLILSERQGVEIDYCPKCRGIWLDRGEIDKIIERSQTYQETRAEESYQNDNKHQYEDYKNNSHSDNRNYQKKRGGFLSDLLDFGGD